MEEPGFTSGPRPPTPSSLSSGYIQIDTSGKRAKAHPRASELERDTGTVSSPLPSTAELRRNVLVRLVRRAFGPRVNAEAVAVVIVLIPFFALFLFLSLGMGMGVVGWLIMGFWAMPIFRLWEKPGKRLDTQAAIEIIFGLVFALGFSLIEILEGALGAVLLHGAAVLVGTVLLVATVETTTTRAGACRTCGGRKLRRAGKGRWECAECSRPPQETPTAPLPMGHAALQAKYGNRRFPRAARAWDLWPESPAVKLWGNRVFLGFILSGYWAFEALLLGILVYAALRGTLPTAQADLQGTVLAPIVWSVLTVLITLMVKLVWSRRAFR